MSLAIVLHVLSVVVWVGGMFFAWMVLRPIAASQLEPPQRLPLWEGVFRRFFPWVWVAVILLPLTGYWMIFGVLGGMKHLAIYIHVMNGIGLVMIALYLYLYFGPFARLKRGVAATDWKSAGAALATIRRIVGFNLILGLINVAVAAGGRFLV